MGDSKAAALVLHKLTNKVEILVIFQKNFLPYAGKAVIIACGRITAGQLHILGGYTR